MTVKKPPKPHKTKPPTTDSLLYESTYKEPILDRLLKIQKKKQNWAKLVNWVLSHTSVLYYFLCHENTFA